MKKSFAIIIILGLLSIVLLNFLPKSNVGKKNLVGESNRDMSGGGETVKESNSETESHQQELSPESLTQLGKLKTNLANAKGKEYLPALNQLVGFFQKNTQLDSAAIYFEKYVEKNPNPDNWQKVAQLYFEAQTYALKPGSGEKLGEKARFYFKKLLDLNPNNLMIKTNYAMTYMESSSPMQGITLLREVIEQEPNYVPALFNLGILSIRSNQFARGKERFEQILKIDPTNYQAALNLGYCLAELNDKKNAKKILDQVVNKSSNPEEVKAAKDLIKEIN